MESRSANARLERFDVVEVLTAGERSAGVVRLLLEGWGYSVDVRPDGYLVRVNARGTTAPSSDRLEHLVSRLGASGAGVYGLQNVYVGAESQAMVNVPTGRES